MNDLNIEFSGIPLQFNGTIDYTHDMSNVDYDTMTLIKNFSLSNNLGSATFSDFIEMNHYTTKGDVRILGYISRSYYGRIHDSGSGYADFDTVNAGAACGWHVMNDCPLDPALEGRIKVIGNDSSALIQFDYSDAIIEIDLDGDGNIEISLVCGPWACN
jgi:hypothetical protein